ncbi:hypothetical protein Q9233_009580 [Columba guinea]|nr:hypothetical protein Q9233_009580 [Columba guinea]
MKAVRNLLIYIFSTYLLVMFGFNAAQDFWCSTLVKGVIYGSYSVSEMFPKNFTNCTWTLENPDPTKYSIYLKFSKKDFSCSNFSLLAYQFDHFSHEKIKDLLKNNHSIMQLCDSKNAFVFLQYDKNFIQIRRVYPIDLPGLHKKEEDQKSFFEFLVLNKVSPSQFGCHVLCTWLESCLKSENGRTESCGIMYTKCTCPQHLGEWGIDDQSLVLLNNVVLPLNEQTEGCLTQELQTTQVCNLSREAKRPPKEGSYLFTLLIQLNPQISQKLAHSQNSGLISTGFCLFLRCAHQHVSSSPKLPMAELGGNKVRGQDSQLIDLNSSAMEPLNEEYRRDIYYGTSQYRIKKDEVLPPGGRESAPMSVIVI